MEKENIESLPVNRHLWYDGKIFLGDGEMKFAELPEPIQNRVKNLITGFDSLGDIENDGTNSVVNWVFPNGYGDFPNRYDDFKSPMFLFTTCCSFTDKYADNKRSEEKKIAFSNLPEMIREAIIEDVLKANGEERKGQLNFSEYLSDSDLKDLFTKEAQEKENAVEKDQKKPEKKKHKSRER